MRPTRRAFVFALAAAAIMASSGPSSAAGYPDRPITVIVPYGAGGAGDTVMRIIQPLVEKKLGQPLVIEARAGGGGNIGTQVVVKAEPNGYTLLLGAANNFVINQYMFKDLPFDPLKDLVLIANPADVPSVLYTNAEVPTRTLAEFIAYAKSRPSKLNYASPSVGTTPHLAVELLKQRTGIDLVHVPYRGAPAAIQALLTNDVQLYLAGYGVGKAFMDQGKIRALAVASPKRLAAIPDVPTAIESGVPDYVASNWWGLAAPKGTPEPVIETIHAAVIDALKDKDVIARLEKLGFEPSYDTPAQLTAKVRKEAETWRAIIVQAKISP